MAQIGIAPYFSWVVDKLLAVSALPYHHTHLNYFAEKHGKNSRDTHFSQISKFIESESKLKQMTSSQDIVDAILKRQEISNKNRLKLSR